MSSGRYQNLNSFYESRAGQVVIEILGLRLSRVLFATVSISDIIRG